MARMARIKAAFPLFGFIRVHPFHPWLKKLVAFARGFAAPRAL
jgi:hypothetical protein